MRNCCMSDDHKPHLDNCERELNWKRRENERLRQTNQRQGRTKKRSERGDSGGQSDPLPRKKR